MSNLVLNNMDEIEKMFEIDYEENGLDLKINFTLHRESQLWIFTRCFVNKDINESYNFDAESVNNGPGEVFNKYTTAIMISKEADSNKNYISFGTYYEDKGEEEWIERLFVRRHWRSRARRFAFRFRRMNGCVSSRS